MKKITLKESQYIYILKFFALISIVAAHCTLITNKSVYWNNIFKFILDILGSIGVPIFYIISGYFFLLQITNYSFKEFFSKKIVSLIIPWIVTGTAIYLYIALRKQGINLKDWLLFLIGFGSYLYYMTLLFVFYMIYNFCSKKVLYVFVLVSLLSILLTSHNYFTFINPYLNPFNFYIYFFIGYIIRNKKIEYNIVKLCTKYRKLLLLQYIVLLYVIYVKELSYGYWGRTTLFVQPLTISLIIGLSNSKILLNNKYFTYIGKQSFSIYLLHLPIAGIIAFLFNKLDLWYLTLLRPFLVILITCSFVYYFKKMIIRYHLSNKLYLCLGIK